MNKRLDGQKTLATERSHVCHHVSAGRINAPKRCVLNHECFHCAYDQWLDAIDLEKMQASFIVGILKHNLAQAA